MPNQSAVSIFNSLPCLSPLAREVGVGARDGHATHRFNVSHLVLGGTCVDAAVGVVGISYLQGRNTIRVDREGVLAGWPDSLAIPVPEDGRRGRGRERKRRKCETKVMRKKR